MESKDINEQVRKPGLGGFLSKILGTGIKETIDSIGNAIDKIDKSDEKLGLQLKYKELLITMESACIDYESKLLDTKSRIIEAEVKGESWLQRNWRPIMMCICMFIIFSNYILVPFFQITPAILDDHIWRMMEFGITGYVAGRSLEKISENLGPVLTTARRIKK